MRKSKRTEYILRSPKILYNVLVRGRYDFEYDLMPVHCEGMPLAKRLNLLKAGANLVTRRQRPWSWPIHLHVELTNYCNLRCPVCPTGNGALERRPAAMAPSLFKQLMDEVGPYLLTASLWGWGESLLHPRLAEILRMVQERGITTFLSTNGQNLDRPDVVQALIDYPPTYLIVALDGLTDETNSVYRAGARVAPALAGVNQIARAKRDRGRRYPILHHRYMAMRHNEHEMPQLRQFARENQFDITTIRTLSIIDAQDETEHRKLVPSTEELQAYRYRDNDRLQRRDFICERAFVFPCVLADGTVTACDQDFNAQQPYGKLTERQSFADLWWGESAARIRKTIRGNADSFSQCRNCPFRDRPANDCSILRL